MSNWRNSLKSKQKELSLGATKKSGFGDQNEVENQKEKLETLFLSQKRLLSILIRIQGYQDELLQQEEDQVDTKLISIIDKIKEEILFISSLNSLFDNQNLFKKLDYQISSLNILNRRTKMLLRLVIPKKIHIIQKEEAFFRKYATMINQNKKCFSLPTEKSGQDLKNICLSLIKKSSLPQQSTHQTRQKTEDNTSNENLKKTILDAQINNEKSPYVLQYFYQVAELFMSQIVSGKNRIEKKIEQKKQKNQEASKFIKTYQSFRKTKTLVTSMSGLKSLFETQQDIATINIYMQSNLYQVIQITNIQALSFMIPGVDVSTNVSINFEKQKKRNKKIIRDIKTYQCQHNLQCQRKHQKIQNKQNKMKQKRGSQATLIVHNIPNSTSKSKSIRTRKIKCKSNLQQKVHQAKKITWYKNPILECANKQNKYQPMINVASKKKSSSFNSQNLSLDEKKKLKLTPIKSIHNPHKKLLKIR